MPFGGFTHDVFNLFVLQLFGSPESQKYVGQQSVLGRTLQVLLNGAGGQTIPAHLFLVFFIVGTKFVVLFFFVILKSIILSFKKGHVLCNQRYNIISNFYYGVLIIGQQSQSVAIFRVSFRPSS